MKKRRPEVVVNKIGYFSIKEVARIVGVSPSSLRNWEKIGLIEPVRSQGRYRLFSREAIERLKKIRYLRKVKQLHPRGILEIFPTTPRAAHSGAGQRRRRPDRIGARLSRLRRRLGLTLTEAAHQANISPSFLSAIERDQGNPSIATFQKLAQLYQTNVLAFFGDGAGGKKLIRPRQRKTLQPEPGIRIELLASGNPVMEVQLWRIAPGASSGGAYHHEGEEFIYLLRGTLEVWLDEVERYVMQPEDSLYFESSHAHRWKNLAKEEAVLLWVNTPPSF